MTEIGKGHEHKNGYAGPRPEVIGSMEDLLVLLMLITVNYVDRASLSVAMPLIAREFTLSPVMQGLILSSFFWTYTLMQIPSGMLVDRFKPRLVITVATLIWGAFQAGAGFCTNACPCCSCGWVSGFPKRLSRPPAASSTRYGLRATNARVALR